MTNPYYKRTSQFQPRTKAKSEEVRSELDAISAGFDQLPIPRDDGKGFSEPVSVEQATEPGHAVTKEQFDQAIQSNAQNLSDTLQAKNQVLSAKDEVSTDRQRAEEAANTAENWADEAQQSAEASKNFDPSIYRRIDDSYSVEGADQAIAEAIGTIPQVASYFESTVSGTWHKESGAEFVLVIIAGGGGSGAKTRSSGSTGAAGAGAGAQVLVKQFHASELPDQVNFIVGSGGSAITETHGNGNPGGNTQFDDLVALGGLGGLQSGGTTRFNLRDSKYPGSTYIDLGSNDSAVLLGETQKGSLTGGFGGWGRFVLPVDTEGGAGGGGADYFEAHGGAHSRLLAQRGGFGGQSVTVRGIETAAQDGGTACGGGAQFVVSGSPDFPSGNGGSGIVKVYQW